MTDTVDAGGGALLMAEALSGERPKNVLGILQSRARRSRLVAESLAAYLQERTELEEAYVKGLQKLQRRPIIAESYGLHLGKGLERVRKRLDTELDETIQLHDQFSQRLNKDVVDVLRERGRLGEASLKQHDTAAAPVLKDWDDFKSRLEKSQGKLGPQNTAKVQAAQQDVVQIQQTWRSTVAPQLFTAYDQADRGRIEVTKETLAKFATMQNDMGRDAMDVAARLLNDVIMWELDEDVSEWLRVEGGGRSGVIEGLSRSEVIRGESSTRDSSSAIGVSTTSASATRAPITIERTPSIHSNRNERTGNSFLSKLKPTLNRPRSSSRADSYGLFGDNAAERSSIYSADLGPEGPTPLARSNMSRAFAATEDGNVADNSFSSTTEREDRRRSFMPSIIRRKNSTAQDKNTKFAKASQAPFGGNVAPVDANVESGLDDSINSTPRPSRIPLDDADATLNHLDAEGFSQPPPGHDRQPWQPVPSTSLMDDEDDAAHAKTTSLSIQPASMHESSTERKAALDKVKSTLLSSAPQGSISKRGAGRDRRAVRSAVFSSGSEGTPNGYPSQQRASMSSARTLMAPAIAATTTSPTPSHENDAGKYLPEPGSPIQSAITVPLSNEGIDSPLASPLQMSVSSSLSQEARGMMSMSPSVASMVSGASLNVFHEPHGEGLRIALTETLQILARSGNVERIVISGEVSMLLRSNATKPLRIRFVGHDAWEKSAANNALLAAVPGSPGHFVVDTSALSSASVATPAAVLRYHLVLSPERASELLPVHIHSQWKCEANQTSIMVNYCAIKSSRVAAKSDSPFDDSATASLHDMTLQIPITSTVRSVQMKPQGAYVRERQLLRFNLPNLDLESEEHHKVLARLAVDEPSQAQPVSMRYTWTGRLASATSIEVLDPNDVKMEELIKIVVGKHTVT